MDQISEQLRLGENEPLFVTVFPNRLSSSKGPSRLLYLPTGLFPLDLKEGQGVGI